MLKLLHSIIIFLQSLLSQGYMKYILQLSILQSRKGQQYCQNVWNLGTVWLGHRIIDLYLWEF